MIEEHNVWQLPGNEDNWEPWPGELLNTGKNELFVRSVGVQDSPPALFVHGLGGSSSNWTDLMGLLSNRVYARALDLPGFGRSEPRRGFGYTFDEHVEAVVELISVQEERPVHLFGNSMGGAIATRVAAENPELVQTLTLISPALPTLRPRGQNTLVGMLAVPRLGTRLVDRSRRRSAEELVVSQMKRVFHDPSQAPAERVEGAIRELEQTLSHSWTDEALTRSTRGLISAYFAHGPRALWRQAASVEAPTLLIWGCHDGLVSPELAGATASAFPHSRLLLLGDAGHMAQIEQPMAVGRAFANLLDDLEHGLQP